MADMDTAFLTSGLEEPCTYIFGKSGPTKLINAQIFRGTDKRANLQMKGASNEQGGAMYDVEIYVSRSDIPAVRVNSDQVQLTKIPGDSAVTTMLVAGIIRMDEGAFRLGLA